MAEQTDQPLKVGDHVQVLTGSRPVGELVAIEGSGDATVYLVSTQTYLYLSAEGDPKHRRDTPNRYRRSDLERAPLGC